VKGLAALAAAAAPSVLFLGGCESRWQEPGAVEVRSKQRLAGDIYHEGTQVQLTAVPATGWQFDDRSGACCGTGTCQVTMDSNETLTAQFSAVFFVPLVMG
jgi:hypothetical protein